MKLKSFLIVLLVSINSFEIQAQYVKIANNEFAVYMKNRHSACFNSSNLLDTVCAGMVADTTLSLNVKLSNIQGVKYFTNLKTISLSETNIDTIPELPRGLVTFRMVKNKQVKVWHSFPEKLRNLLIESSGLTKLPTLPAGLQSLHCGKNPLTDLSGLPVGLKHLLCNDIESPALVTLPPTLETFDCSGNLWKKLPDLPNTLITLYCDSTLFETFPILPEGLKTLTVGENNLTSLPVLPQGLIWLGINNNKLKKLPVIPNSVEYLDCSRNDIDTIKTLPANLTHLNCSFNFLTSIINLPVRLKILSCNDNGLSTLPSLPDSITELDCRNNRITSLPSLPGKLSHFLCSNNRLKSLPALPEGLDYLICNANEMLCLPHLPSTLGSMDFDDNLILCLPNFPAELDPFYKKYPICNSTNNKNLCTAESQILGRIFIDSDKNGKYTEGESGPSGVAVRIANSNKFTFTSNTGFYNMSVDSIGIFTFTSDQIKNFKLSPTSKTYSFVNYEQELKQDFILTPDGETEDIKTQLTAKNLARPGFKLAFEGLVTNIGTLIIPTTSVFKYSSEYIIDSISDGGIILQQGLITWNQGNLNLLESRTLKVFGRLSPTATLGSEVEFSFSSNLHKSSDSDIENNTSKTVLVIRGSFDPNDKAATPALTKFEVENGAYINYTIRFQNTGTDTAFTVVVSDTLSAALQANTLQMLSTSHNCKTTVKGNKISFEFNDIKLLWSGVNEPLSHGYINFRINPVATLQLGDIVKNKAFIYFDYNSPIITNSAETSVKNLVLTNLENTESETSFFVYPNPASTFITIPKGHDIEIYKVSGEIAWKGKSNDQKLDISSFLKGVYYIKMHLESGESHVNKFVKE